MCTTYMRFYDFLECFVIMCSISPVSTAQIVSAISVEQLLEDGTKNNGPQSDGSLITLLRMKTAALASYHTRVEGCGMEPSVCLAEICGSTA